MTEISGTPDPYEGDPVFEGLVPAVSPARALVIAVEQKLADTYGAFWRNRLPDDLKLYMHPSVRRELWKDASFMSFEAFRNGGDIEAVFYVPVHVTIDGLMPGQWKLAIITENVLLGGTLLPPDERGTGGLGSS